MKEAGSKKKLLIWIAAGVLLCFTAALSRGIFGAASAKDVFGMLSDSCFLTGVLLGGLGGLSYMASEGFYDIFSYGIKRSGSCSGPESLQNSSSTIKKKRQRQGDPG